jgi:hypothetical protein
VNSNTSHLFFSLSDADKELSTVSGKVLNRYLLFYHYCFIIVIAIKTTANQRTMNINCRETRVEIGRKVWGWL